MLDVRLRIEEGGAVNPLVAVCRASCRGIPGATVVEPGGGIRFSRRGVEGRVEFSRGNTDIAFDTKGMVHDSLTVGAAGFWHGLKDLFGFKDFQVGDPKFDWTFEIRTSRREFAMELLRPEVRPIFLSLERYHPFLWRVSEAGFLLRVHLVPGDSAALDRMIEGAFQLVDIVLESGGGEGIRTTGVELSVKERADCDVCGCTLSEGAVVRCSRCGTAHHRDCWAFNGKCAVYACGETRFRA